MRITKWKLIVAICIGVAILAGIAILCISKFKTPDDEPVIELTFAESDTVGIDFDKFTDVAGHPSEAYIKAMTLVGVSRGRTDSKFAPDEHITRAEFTEMVAFATGLKPVEYTGIYADIAETCAYAGIVEAAHSAGLIDTGFVTGNTFGGDTLITRTEIAYILSAGYRQLTGQDAASDVITDLTTNTPDGKMTRADAVKLVFELYDTNPKMLQWTFDTDLSSWKTYLRTADTSTGKINAKGSVDWTQADGHTAPGCILYDLTYTGMNQINAFWWECNISAAEGTNLLDAGQSYLLTFYAKVEGNDDPVNLNAAKFVNPSNKNQEYTNIGTASLSGDGWQLYALELTSTADAGQAQLLFQAGGCDNHNTKIFIDDICLVKFEKYLGIRATTSKKDADNSVITGSGKYLSGQTAQLIASGKPAGNKVYLADTWIDEEYGNVVGLGSVYRNVVSKHRAMRVSFREFSVQEKDWGFAASGTNADVELTDVSRDSGNVTVYAKLSVPQNYTLVDAGILFHDGSYTDNFSVFTEDAVVVRPSEISTDGTFEVARAGYEATSDVLVKGYAICKDTAGNYIVFYGGDMVATIEKDPAEVDYQMIYNLEMLYLFVHSDPEVEGAWNELVRRISVTDADMITLTPQACRTNLWPTEVEDQQFHDNTLDHSAARVYDKIKTYMEDGHDPFQEMLDIFRENGFETVFVDYRMNEKQNTDAAHPFHSPYYLDHEEYWLNPDSLTNNRVFNYMESEVREYYFNLLKELVTNYDVDGLSLDFERAPIFFKNEEIAEGTQVMTDFVGRVRAMLDEVGAAKGKYLPLGVRVCSSLENSLSVGLDVEEWVERGYVDYVNATNTYYNVLSVDVESYVEAVGDGTKVYGELNYVVYEPSVDQGVYATPENLKSVAEYYYAKGVDGLSAFNMDYSKNTTQTFLGLSGITDRESLATKDKHYVLNTRFDFTTENGVVTAKPYLAVDTSNFEYGILRVRTDEPCTDAVFSVSVNGRQLNPAETTNLVDKTELFPRLVQNSPAYPTASYVKFYIIPLDAVNNGDNEIIIRQLAGSTCKVELIDIGIYRENSSALTAPPVEAPAGAGAILFEHDFSDLNGWTNAPAAGLPAGATASIVDDKLSITIPASAPASDHAGKAHKLSNYAGKITIELDASVTFPAGTGANKLGSSVNVITDGGISACVYIMNGRLGYYDISQGMGKRTPMKDYTSGSTIHMKIVADTESNTYDIYVDDVLVAREVKFRNAGTKFIRIQLSAHGGTGATATFDNLKITSGGEVSDPSDLVVYDPSAAAAKNAISTPFADSFNSMNGWSITPGSGMPTGASVGIKNGALSIKGPTSDSKVVGVTRRMKDLTGRITFEMDMTVTFPEGAPATQPGAAVLVRTDGGMSLCFYVFNGKFGYYNVDRSPSAGVTQVSEYISGSTVHVKMIADTTTDTYYILVDDQLIAANVKFRNNGNKFDLIQLGTGGNDVGASVTYDNLKITAGGEFPSDTELDNGIISIPFEEDFSVLKNWTNLPATGIPDGATVGIKDGVLSIEASSAVSTVVGKTRELNNLTGRIAFEVDMAVTFPEGAPDNKPGGALLVRTDGGISLCFYVLNGKLGYFNVDRSPSAGLTQLGEYVSGTTIRLKMVADTETGTYDIYIDNELLVGGVKFRDDGSAFTRIQLSTGGTDVGASVVFDNLKITESDESPDIEDPNVPTPSTFFFEEDFTDPTGWKNYSAAGVPEGATVDIVDGALKIVAPTTISEIAAVTHTLDNFQGTIAFEMDVNVTFPEGAPATKPGSTILVNTAGGPALCFYIFNGTFGYYNVDRTPSAGVTRLGEYVSGTTIRLKMIADTETGTYDIYIDDELLIDGVKFRSSGSAFTRIQLGTGGNDVGPTIVFDNLKIYTVEDLVIDPPTDEPTEPPTEDPTEPPADDPTGEPTPPTDPIELPKVEL